MLGVDCYEAMPFLIFVEAAHSFKLHGVLLVHPFLLRAPTADFRPPHISCVQVLSLHSSSVRPLLHPLGQSSVSRIGCVCKCAVSAARCVLPPLPPALPI